MKTTANNGWSLYVATAVGVFLLTVRVSTAAPFLDDFSADTSTNYIGTATYGSGGGFDVSGGTLNIDSSSYTTYDVFHKTARLEVGETVRVVSQQGNPTDLYLTVSTTTRGPNTPGEHGIRLNWVGSFRARVYNNGDEANMAFGDAVASGSEVELYISRVTDTEYAVGYFASQFDPRNSRPRSLCWHRGLEFQIVLRQPPGDKPCRHTRHRQLYGNPSLPS